MGKHVALLDLVVFLLLLAVIIRIIFNYKVEQINKIISAKTRTETSSSENNLHLSFIEENEQINALSARRNVLHACTAICLIPSYLLFHFDHISLFKGLIFRLL
jgi:hypothetical protein